MGDIAVAVLTAAVALAATGCTSNPDAAASPSPTPSAVASSPSPTPTASPDLAAQLEAAARAFYEEATRAAATGDVSRLQAMAVSNCSCQQLVRYIRDKWASGRLRGASFVVHRVGPAQVEPRVKIVPILRSATAYEVLDSSGRVIQRVPARPTVREDIYLRLSGGVWVVENVVVIR